MEPLNDDELKDLLREWQPPSAPATMKPPKEQRDAWWRWWISGTIRVPVPVGLAAMVIVALSMYWAIAGREAAQRPPHSVTLADFQPVKQLQPRVIRSSYEGE
jgi:hypothetical protein